MMVYTVTSTYGGLKIVMITTMYTNLIENIGIKLPGSVK